MHSLANLLSQASLLPESLQTRMQQLLVQVASEKRNPLENSQATLLSEFKQRHLLASL